MKRAFLSLGLVLVLGVAAYTGYRLLRSAIQVDVYRTRLVELRRDYAGLKDQYNEAVRRTAVTELQVQDGKLTVSIRTAAGEIETLETPFDPTLEIYVDYVVVDGRLWIRRVFDEKTPPGEGLLVDPKWMDVDWDAAGASHGKATYRQLGDGRWVVTVTGDGSLGLARPERATVELSPPPPIREFEPIDREIDENIRQLTVTEIAQALGRQLGLP
jgi:hypothetical protein